MNVLRWCPFVHLFESAFRNSPYGHGTEHRLLAEIEVKQNEDESIT